MTEPLFFDTPDSSMTTRVYYHPDDKVLSLSTRSGKPINLANVPIEHFKAMQQPGVSVGKYYHANLKSFAAQ